MKITDPPIIVEESFDVSQETLWKVITKLDHMHKWFFDSIPAFEPVLGFETSFILSAGEREFDHTWKIIEVVEGAKIVYDWHYPGYEGRAHVIFEVAEDENGSKIVLTNITTEDWQQDIPEFKRESAIGGWNYFIKQSLKNYIAEL